MTRTKRPTVVHDPIMVCPECEHAWPILDHADPFDGRCPSCGNEPDAHGSGGPYRAQMLTPCHACAGKGYTRTREDPPPEET